ncbi:MAG: ABC transporter ATP-binding protein [Mycoplasmoidaceae bacterium]
MKSNNSKKNFNTILVYGSKYKLRFILIIILSIFSIASNVLSTFMVGFGLEELINNVNNSTNIITEITIFSTLLALFYAIYSGFRYLSNLLMIRLTHNLGFTIRKDLFFKIQKLPFSYLDVQSTGDVMSRLTSDVEVFTTTLSQQGVEFISGVITVLGMLIGMFILSPILTVILLVTMPIMFFVIVFILKKAQPYFMKRQKYTGVLNGFAEEYISSQKVVNLFSYQKEAFNKFKDINKDLSLAVGKSRLISGVIFPYNNFVNNFMLMFITLIAVVFISNGIAIGGATSLEGIGLIFPFILLQRQFSMPITNFFSMINQFQLAFAGANRFFEILNEKEEPQQQSTNQIKVTNALVEFKNINFSYVEGIPIINDLSFKAIPGGINAIVGATGSGKTTLISLLTRFYEINSGSIEIDGQDIAKFCKHNIRENITIVLQDTFLFSESIRENISYGNMKATDQEIIEAAKSANAWHFIEQLPNGLDTILYPDNSIISEGEKQLIAIARAFLSKARIIILDEATSYVDTKTEKEIQEAMAKLMKGRTSFVIAHRLSTIKKADQIIVLQKGELKEKGTHNQLLSKKGLYYNMIQSGMSDDN